MFWDARNATQSANGIIHSSDVLAALGRMDAWLMYIVLFWEWNRNMTLHLHSYRALHANERKRIQYVDGAGNLQVFVS